ncbi:MAG: YqgE/AlgH family protein [Gammaproteobacteria bacterium]|nr:YqgE/AlgH family protein [Gammaproteobacteria bacterium]
MIENNLNNQYLLATPSIKDPLFASSMVYMCDHSKDGSMGMVVNHLADQNLGEVLDQLDINCSTQSIRELPVFIGGPVNLQQGFVLHTPLSKWEKTIQVGPGTCLTSSKDIIEAIANDEGPEHFLVLLGFSGWSAGQLEQELQHNSWLTAQSSENITFNENIDHKWQMAFDQLGFKLDKLSPTTGNA